jgi:hypothetical protein
LETASPDAANFLNCVWNCSFFDKQWMLSSGQFSDVYRYGWLISLLFFTSIAWRMFSTGHTDCCIWKKNVVIKNEK